MASLKEVRSRIQSVTTTRKITQARQMISSAKLHRMQAILENATKYHKGIEETLSNLISTNYTLTSPLCAKRENGSVAIIIISSNSGMCGAFNSRLEKQVEELRTQHTNNDIQFYPIGKKIREYLKKNGFSAQKNLDHLADKASYEEVAVLASQLIQQFLTGKLKQIEVVYYNFRTAASQDLLHKTLLPLPIKAGSEYNDEYILEPSLKELINELTPKLISANLYAMFMNNSTSEHAARTIAMQLATENADEILEELQLNYNKLRQQNITSELLDIIGASFG